MPHENKYKYKCEYKHKHRCRLEGGVVILVWMHAYRHKTQKTDK